MKRRLLAVVTATAAAAVLAAPASADKPTVIRNVQIHNVVQNPTACGDFGVVWDINIVADVHTFFKDGRRVRQVVHIKEDNTITNTVTGKTLREGPDSFQQTAYFNPDGTLDYITASGLQARVGNIVMDVGRVVLEPLGMGRFDLVFTAGQHPVREAADDATIAAALTAFCDVLR